MVDSFLVVNGDVLCSCVYLAVQLRVSKGVVMALLSNLKEPIWVVWKPIYRIATHGVLKIFSEHEYSCFGLVYILCYWLTCGLDADC